MTPFILFPLRTPLSLHRHTLVEEEPSTLDHPVILHFRQKAKDTPNDRTRASLIEMLGA